MLGEGRDVDVGIEVLYAGGRGGDGFCGGCYRRGSRRGRGRWRGVEGGLRIRVRFAGENGVDDGDCGFLLDGGDALGVDGL